MDKALAVRYTSDVSCLLSDAVQSVTANGWLTSDPIRGNLLAELQLAPALNCTSASEIARQGQLVLAVVFRLTPGLLSLISCHNCVTMSRITNVSLG